MTFSMSSANTTNFDAQLVSHISRKFNESAKSILQTHKYLHKFIDNSGRTLLHVSAEHANVDIAKYLIQCGCKVDAQDAQGITPLMLAVSEANDDAIVEFLLNKNADIYLKDNVRQSSALRKVIKTCQTHLEFLNAGRFIRTRYYRVVKMFFARLEREFIKDKERMVQTLHDVHCPFALVMFMNNAEVTEYLLEIGYPSAEFIKCWSALHIAVLLGDVDNVTVLVKDGADVNELDNQRQTPLFLYDKIGESSNDQLEILRILLRHGASLISPRFDEVTPMQYFFTSCRRNTLLALVDSADSKELKKSTADGRTALHFLIENHEIRDLRGVMELLLTKTNMDVDTRDSKGESALIKAVKAACVEKIEMLLDFGAKVNLIDIFDKTDLFDQLTNPYGYPVMYSKIVEMLVHRGNAPSNSVQFRNDRTFRLFVLVQLQNDRDSSLAKLMLKHLVLDEASGESVNEATCMKIQSKKTLNDYYESCKSELQMMKTSFVYGTVTLYKLLSESDEKITLYARNDDFLKVFDQFMRDNYRDDCYYYDFLMKRINRAVDMASMRYEASRVLCQICPLYPDPNHDVYYKITKYMSSEDLGNLLII